MKIDLLGVVVPVLIPKTMLSPQCISVKDFIVSGSKITTAATTTINPCNNASRQTSFFLSLFTPNELVHWIKFIFVLLNPINSCDKAQNCMLSHGCHRNLWMILNFFGECESAFQIYNEMIILILNLSRFNFLFLSFPLPCSLHLSHS